LKVLILINTLIRITINRVTICALLQTQIYCFYLEDAKEKKQPLLSLMNDNIFDMKQNIVEAIRQRENCTGDSN